MRAACLGMPPVPTDANRIRSPAVRRKQTSSEDEDRQAAAESQIWEVPVTLPEGEFTAYLSEPADSSIMEVLQQLRRGEYPKPYVLDNGEHRELYIGQRFTQSLMSLHEPDALDLAYTRSMMAFLLFQPEPRHVMLVGLGGGSLTKACYRGLPKARITTIEIERTVIELASLFHVPNPGARLRLVHADAATYFASTRQSADVVLVDGCDAVGLSPSLCSESFYASVRSRLRPGGVLVSNLVGTIARIGSMIDSIARVFDGQILVLRDAVSENRVVLAFCNPSWPPDWARVRAGVPELAQRHALDLGGMAKQLQLNFRRSLGKAGNSAKRRR